MGKKIVNDYHRKIFNELIDADIDKELIDNVFKTSQKQLETLKNKTIDHDTPDTVQDVYEEFLKINIK